MELEPTVMSGRSRVLGGITVVDTSARTAGVFWRADPEDLRILDGPDDRKRAELISERLTRWRSITSA